MNQELAITSQQYGLIFGIFFFGYLLFEIPSNLLLHKIGARVWVARILMSWGIVVMLTGFVHSVHQLYVVRFLLGLAEAGYFPGIVLYLTYWFPRREQARAFALLVMANPVATILGAPVSVLILDHVHWLGVSSWRWLLILEGAPAIVCGVLTYFLLPSRPDEARFLSVEEKAQIKEELGREERQKLEEHPYSLFQVLAGARTWHLVLIYSGMMIGQYALTSWAPQLVKSLSPSYSNSMVGLLVAIPYLVGLAAMILVSWSSDRKLERRYHAAIPALLGGMGLLLLGTTRSAGVFRGPVNPSCRWHLQLLRTFLGIAQRVSNRILGGSRHRLGELRWQSRRVYRAIHDRGDCYENGKPLRRPGTCWDPIASISDTRPALAQKRASAGVALKVGGDRTEKSKNGHRSIVQLSPLATKIVASPEHAIVLKSHVI